MSASVPLPVPASQANDPAPTARSFLQTLEQALTRLTTLRITTVVSDVDVTGGGLDTVVAARPAASAEAASTEINLLEGQITNIFSTGFAALSGGTLQAFHQAQVEKSSGMVAANLIELQRLATALLSTRR